MGEGRQPLSLAEGAAWRSSRGRRGETVFLPIHDDHPVRHVSHPFVCHGIIAVNVLVFLAMKAGWLFGGEAETAVSLGFIPAVFFGSAVLPADFDYLPSWCTIVTAMFLHAGWMHLIGNMMFLWVFGDNVEDDIGHLGFLVFYLACGVAAALAHGFAQPEAEAPMIGASGAVAGIIGAYVMLHPRVRVWVLVLMRIPLRITAAWMIAAWLLFQVFNALVLPDEAVAWWAHIGGFLAGAILIGAFKRRGVAYFGGGTPTPSPPAG
jgi:membrane associated rhomboid family serine protease